MSAVVVHDGTIHPGGAVKVVVEAARALDADVVVGFSGPDHDWWARRCPNDVRVLSKPRHLLNDARNARRMRRLDLEEYDLVLTSGPATKFYRPVDGQHRIHYLHHPPLAALWNDGGVIAYVQSVLDRVETLTLPVVVANSELTAERYHRHYGRRTDAVVNPPVDVDAFDPGGSHDPDRFVLVGRLEARKRPGLAIDAFTRLGAESGDDIPRLDVVGDGPLRDELERRAGPNVTFHGFVEDDRLVALTEAAHAGVFLAKREDFGITPVEYLAAGLPVLAADEPNTNNQVDDGVTGLLVEPELAAVEEGITALLARDWDRTSIAEAARAYHPARFREQLEAVVDAQ